MVKVELQELVLAIDLLKKTSTDVCISFTEDGHSLHLSYMDADGQLVIVHLYDVDTKKMAKIQKTERLAFAAKRK